MGVGSCFRGVSMVIGANLNASEPFFSPGPAVSSFQIEHGARTEPSRRLDYGSELWGNATIFQVNADTSQMVTLCATVVWPLSG